MSMDSSLLHTANKQCPFTVKIYFPGNKLYASEHIHVPSPKSKLSVENNLKFLP